MGLVFSDPVVPGERGLEILGRALAERYPLVRGGPEVRFRFQTTLVLRSCLGFTLGWTQLPTQPWFGPTRGSLKGFAGGEFELWCWVGGPFWRRPIDTTWRQSVWTIFFGGDERGRTRGADFVPTR